MFTRVITRAYSTTRPSRAALNRWAKTGFKVVGSFGLLWWFTDRVASVVWIEGGSMRPALNPDPYSRYLFAILIQHNSLNSIMANISASNTLPFEYATVFELIVEANGAAERQI